jgi:bifunctional ADP-heptose synthase (sugar kinase/adenylyltransferase)
VVNNLASLGVGEIRVVGFTGDDGAGFELRRALESLGVETAGLLPAPDRVTPVYTKPMFRDRNGPETEGERFDIKNRLETDPALESALVAALDSAAKAGGSIIALDQVQEADCGVVTGRVREHLNELGRSRPELLILADSRCRIAHFKNVMLKPNLSEARAVFPGAGGITDLLELFFHRAGRPIFLTGGSAGINLYDGTRVNRVDAIKVPGPVDPVGAGDTVSASLCSALAVGASPLEAAQLAVLAASVTVQKIGMTGTASPGEILDAAAQLESN